MANFERISSHQEKRHRELQLSERKKNPNQETSSDGIRGIVPGVFPYEEGMAILRQHAGIYHTVTGTFGRMLATAERIIRILLRQHV